MVHLEINVKNEKLKFLLKSFVRRAKFTYLSCYVTDVRETILLSLESNNFLKLTIILIYFTIQTQASFRPIDWKLQMMLYKQIINRL